MIATVRYLPMIGLGGDFVDIAVHPDGRVTLIVIDVTGHGVSAALLVNRVCSEGRKLMRENLSPAEILQELNRFFHDSFSQTGLFLTAMTVCIDTTAQKLVFAGSAHPPALLWKIQDGTLVELPSKNMIIGFGPTLDHPHQEEVEVQSGDRLLIYTDGVIEAENREEKALGIDGFSEMVQRFSSLPLEASADSLVQAVKQYCGDQLGDDVLLLAAEFSIP